MYFVTVCPLSSSNKKWQIFKRSTIPSSSQKLKEKTIIIMLL
jgi:hypothetical protein